MKSQVLSEQIKRWQSMKVVCVGTPNVYAVAVVMGQIEEQIMEGDIMKSNCEATTMKNNPVALAQSELDAASSELLQARKAYRFDHSDANFTALESAREKFLRVENEIRSGQKTLMGVG